MSHARLLVVAAVFAVVAAMPAVADEERGKLLYENHCTSCHESGVHIRETREARDRAGVMRKVVRFSEHLGLQWSAKEMRDVTDYLAAEHYGFAADI